MSEKIDLGRNLGSIQVHSGKLRSLQREAVPHAIADLSAALQNTLTSPTRFPPLNRAITSDDRIAIAIDDRSPCIAELIGGIAQHVLEAGVRQENITLVSPLGSRQSWLEAIPDELSELNLEVHDRKNPQRLAYLSTSASGQRVYLNRTIVESDQLIVVAEPRFPEKLGYSSIQQWFLNCFGGTPEEDESATPAIDFEKNELFWLLGAPFFIQPIPAEKEGLASIVSGSTEALATGRGVYGKFWNCAASSADLVIAPVGLRDSSEGFHAIARAAAIAGPLVEPGGLLAILSDFAPPLTESFQQIPGHAEPADALREIPKSPLVEVKAARGWLKAVRDCRVYWMCPQDAEVVESLFATPIRNIAEVQKLADSANTLLVVPDADRMDLRGIE